LVGQLHRPHVSNKWTFLSTEYLLGTSESLHCAMKVELVKLRNVQSMC